MDRRRFLLTSLAGALAAPLAAEAQQAAKVRRIGMLITFSPEHPMGRRLLDAFRQGLHELGYVEGKNLLIESRSAQGEVGRVERLLVELEGLRVEVIFLQGGTPAAQAAKRAQISIPIVAPAMADPVRDGVIVSLARPGGNVTGSTFLGPGLVPKRVELIREALPKVVRVAALWHPTAYGEGTMTDMVQEAQATAQTLKVRLQLLEARRPDDFEPAFSAMTREHAGALIVFPSVMFFEHHARIVGLAQKHGLAAIYAFREAVEAGGLMSYGANLPELFRLSATQVDRILRGARAAEVPVEQPTKFELVINLKTAKALGLTIPPSLLARADEVIE